MEQLDRRTKLLIVGGACLLLVIAIIVLVVSCNANRQKEPEPIPVVEASPTPVTTPVATQTPTPIPTRTPAEITAPALPTPTPVATPTPTPPPKQTAGVPSLPSGSTTPKPQQAASTAPAFDFGLPSVANVGAQVVVNPSSKNVAAVNWSLTKGGFLGIQTSGAYQGTLNANGGSISFGEPGTYTLTATAQNSAGKTVTVSQQIEIIAVGKFAFGLPKTAYTDTVVDVEVLEGVEGAVAWSIVKDGQTMTLTDAFSGTLADNGGFITFRQAGKYTITGKASAGKAYNAEITVYPLLQIPFTLPATVYRNIDAAVQMGETYLDGQTIAWSVEQGGAAAEHTGTLTNEGGALSFPALGIYSVTASVGDTHTGRVFSETRQIRVVNQRPNAPEGTATVTITRNGGKVLVEFAATATDPDGDQVTLEWMNRGDDYFTVGSHMVRVRARDSIGDYSPWTSVSFEVPNTPPDTPVGIATIHRDNVVSRKAYVTFDATSTDPDGDSVTYEWENRAADDYYALGAYTARVRARDSFGAYSDWADVPFEITNQAPERPVITRTPAEPFILPGNTVTMTASAVDPDGDTLEYIWENRASETYAYPDGRQIVKVKAVDAFGAESPTKRIMFLMGDPNRAGNLMLTGPDSSLSEPGIEDATLIYYKFIVPPVDGHYGQDFGRVRGYNRLTGQWDQLDYGTTSNGISFERTLQAGIYTKLDLYYFTNHDCMYNKSNITYVALFEFDELDE
ncbi:MAG: hypothetical protein ACI4N0_07680 [Christensenellales bacterium]